MACACGSKKKNGAPKTWTHVSPNGVQTSYSSEQDARLAMANQGGTLKSS